MTTSAVEAAANATALLAGSDGSDCMNSSDIGEVFSRHFLLTSDMQPEIKNEPPEDINDTPAERTACGDDNDDYNCSNSNSNEGVSRGEGNGNSNGTGGSDSPLIRLTPTVKLMATPNPTDPKRKFVCPYENCTKSYGKSSHLRSHLTWHTGIKPFVCHEANCGKGFTRSDELNRHVRTHTGEKPFECVQCTKKFSRSDHLTKHLATHAKQMQHTAAKRLRVAQENQAQLDVADRGAVGGAAAAETSNLNASLAHADKPDVKKLMMNMQSSGEHMSYSDGMNFMAALINANKAIDGADMDAEESENLTDEPMLKHEPIKIKLERPEHSSEYHVVPATLPVAHLPVPTLPPPPLTPKPQLQHMQQRERELHGYSHVPPPAPLEIKPEPQDEMHMQETNMLSMLPYNATTTAGLSIPPHFQDYPAQPQKPYSPPERPFRCTDCAKRFKRQDDLNRHVRTHTGEKPYVCNECDRRFVRKDHLNKHMKTHTKVQPALPTTVAS